MGDRLGIPGAVGFSFSNICLCSSFYPPSFKLTTRSRINEINKQLFNDLLIAAFPYKAGQGRAGQVLSAELRHATSCDHSARNSKLLSL